MKDSPDNIAKEFTEFDLAQEMAEAEQKKPWPMGRYSHTLLKAPDMRMLLISMEKDAALKEHHVDGPISVQVLKGAVRFTVGAEARELKPGHVVALGASVKHEALALEDCAFLITISWPEAARLEAMTHRGYGT